MFIGLYRERGPHKPYCTDYLGSGLMIRPLEMALRYKYIQLNPPGIQWALIFDLDYETWAHVASEDCGLPDPTWIVGNPENGHAHLVYVLKTPVCTSDAGRRKPLLYLAAIERAFRQRLHADPLYPGLITKNPARTDVWKVFYVGQLAYELNELGQYVPDELAERPTKRPLSEVAGLGRNCYVFEIVRLWSYSAIRKYWGKEYAEWYQAVLCHCQEINATLGTPLDGREVHGIAKSIALWTWQRITPEGLSGAQRRSIERRWGPSQKKNGQDLLHIGVDLADVASVAGVSLRTVQRWRAEADPERQTVTALKPWEALGIRRSWYYELLKAGRLEEYKKDRGDLG